MTFYRIDEFLALVALPFMAMGSSCFGVKGDSYTSVKTSPTIITLCHWKCRIIRKTANAIHKDWDLPFHRLSHFVHLKGNVHSFSSPNSVADVSAFLLLQT